MNYCCIILCSLIPVYIVNMYHKRNTTYYIVYYLKSTHNRLYKFTNNLLSHIFIYTNLLVYIYGWHLSVKCTDLEILIYKIGTILTFTHYLHLTVPIYPNTLLTAICQVYLPRTKELLPG